MVNRSTSAVTAPIWLLQHGDSVRPVRMQAGTPTIPTSGVPKFRRPSKIVPNWTPWWKLLKNSELRTPTPQDVRKKCSKILKLPRFAIVIYISNDKLVVMNSLNVLKIKKTLLYEMKFIVPNYSCLQNPWLGGYRPQIPVLSVLNWICWTPPNKIPGCATDSNWVSYESSSDPPGKTGRDHFLSSVTDSLTFYAKQPVYKRRCWSTKKE